MYICKYCGKECKSKMSLVKHEQYCIKNPNHLSREVFKIFGEKGNKILKEKRIPKTKIKYDLICERCGKHYSLDLYECDYLAGRYSKHCSRSCANVRSHSEETKHKQSQSVLQNAIQHRCKDRICKCCGSVYKHYKYNGSSKIFCSEKCSKYYKEHYRDFLSEDALRKISENGRKVCNNQFNLKRSKAEIYFYELCKSKFDNVLSNQLMFNGWDADIILPDYKIAILYNGPWHYIQISKKVSLSQIQNRDKIKIEEIKKCGYIPYIIKDEGSFNKEFVEKQFKIFIDYIRNINIAD